MTYTAAELFAFGGPMMWPLLVCAVLTIAIILDRLMALRNTHLQADRFLDDVRDAVKRRKISEALAICDRTPSPLAAMVRAGLARHEQGRDAVRQAIEDAGAREIHRLERYLAALGAIAHVAPLLGLLGTSLGLIRCFHVLQLKTSALQPVGPADLAHGVWQALFTTTAGLAIAIPAVLAYHYFIRRVHQHVWELQQAAGDLLQWLAGDSAV